MKRGSIFLTKISLFTISSLSPIAIVRGVMAFFRSVLTFQFGDAESWSRWESEFPSQRNFQTPILIGGLCPRQYLCSHVWNTLSPLRTLLRKGKRELMNGDLLCPMSYMLGHNLTSNIKHIHHLSKKVPEWCRSEFSSANLRGLVLRAHLDLPLKRVSETGQTTRLPSFLRLLLDSAQIYSSRKKSSRHSHLNSSGANIFPKAAWAFDT